MSTTTSSILCRLTLAIGFLLPCVAHAVWDESIRIVGDEPVPAGATVTLTFDSGETIDGEVRNEGDNQFIVFLVPGDSPRAGTIRLRTEGGSRSYRLDARSAAQLATLDLSGVAVSFAGSVPAPERPTPESRSRDWSFSVGLNGSYYWNDYFANQIGDNERSLVDILNGTFGGANTSVSGSADDDGASYGVSASVSRRVTSLGSVYLRGSYYRDDALSGRITGLTDVAGNAVTVRASGQSELDFVGVSLGYASRFSRTCRWGWYGGVGYTWADLSDESFTQILVNGVVADSFNASTNDSEAGFFLEGGLSYTIPRKGYSYQFTAGVQETEELFLDERQTRVVIELGLSF